MGRRQFIKALAAGIAGAWALARLAGTAYSGESARTPLSAHKIKTRRGRPLTPETLYEEVMANPNLKVEGQVTGEGFCWHAAFGANRFVTAYEAFGDAGYLDQGVRYFDWLTGLMANGPDGYKGWIGPFIYDKSVWCDVHVGDAIVLNPMLKFAETVLDNPDLEARFGDKARGYVELAQKHLLEKWEARGTWQEDGPYGGYVSWDRYMPPGDLSAWRKMDIRKSTLSLPFNKQNDMAIASLRIYRMTGEEAYWDRAQRIFLFMKRRFRYTPDHYVWNYWEPLGPWDVDPETDRPNHWVGVHPYRNYQAGEVADIAEAYHSGLVFDETDIRRIINTNLQVMWNGDRKNPRWRNSDSEGPWDEERESAREKHEHGKAGTLWTGLLDFDQTIRDLYEVRLDSESLPAVHYREVTAQRPPSFERRHASGSPGTLPGVGYTDCTALAMAAAMPSVLRPKSEMVLMAKSRATGSLAIQLVSGSGDVVAKLHEADVRGATDGMDGFSVVRWRGHDLDGQSVPRGKYTVRWEIGGKYREFPIEIE